MAQTLPFTSDPAQSFTVGLGGTNYLFTARYNDAAGFWTFDLAKDSGATVLVTEVPILIGVNLLSPYALETGGLVATDLSGAFEDAGPDDFGDRVIVSWLSPDELAALIAAGAPL